MKSFLQSLKRLDNESLIEAIHGREHLIHGSSSGEIADWHVIQMTKRPDVAEQYSGKNGRIFLIEKKNETKNLTDADIEEFARYEYKRNPSVLYGDFDEEEFVEEMVKAFNPDDIVNSADAYDNTEIMTDLSDYYGNWWREGVDTHGEWAVSVKSAINYIPVKYNPRMKVFIKSLKRPGNESLIEAIIKGYNAIFESDDINDNLLVDARNYKTADAFVKNVLDNSNISIQGEIKTIPINKIKGTDYLELDKALSKNEQLSVSQAENIVSPTDDYVIGKKVEYPIEVIDNGDGTYNLMAGNHRLVQKLINGETDVVANIQNIKGKSTVSQLIDIWNKAQSMFEATEKKSELQILKDNKVPLTDEERKEVFKKDAVWHCGSSIDPNTGEKVQKVSAVWKSKHPKTGDITYVSNTHRLYNTAKSLDAIINKFHNFVKDSA